MAKHIKNRGIALYLQRKYTETVDEYEKAYQLFLKIDDQAKISAILNNRVIIWVVQGEYSKALNECEKPGWSDG